MEGLIEKRNKYQEKYDELVRTRAAYIDAKVAELREKLEASLDSTEIAATKKVIDALDEIIVYESNATVVEEETKVFQNEVPVSTPVVDAPTSDRANIYNAFTINR